MIPPPPPELANPIAPLWSFVIAVGVAVALIAWAEWRQEKDDVQQLLDQRKDDTRQQMRDA